MLRKILGLVAVLIAGLLAFAATQPDSFEVKRSILIKAPAERIFPLVNDFKQFALWSPWEKLDPNLKRSLSAPSSGKGASYEWEGNDEVGKGKMEIALSQPSEKVLMNLHFMKPFEARNVAEFTFSPKGESTEVSWKMTGPSPFVTKLMHVFVSMDKLVGSDFEAGLVNLKTLAEK